MNRARTIGTTTTAGARPRRLPIALGAALVVGMAAGMAVALVASPAWAICTDVTTQSVSFGNYDDTAGSPLDGQGQVQVVCDVDTPYEVQLGPGGNSGGTFSPRRMARVGGTYFLDYNLYLDPARTQVWGDGTGATLVINDTSQGAQNVHQIFGRVFALQAVGVGAYNDSVLVSVIY